MITPFSAFALFVTSAVAHQHYSQADGNPTPPTAPLAAPRTTDDTASRGKSYTAKDVLVFQSAEQCQQAGPSDAKLCGDFPKLNPIPSKDSEWLELAKKAVVSFSLGFGQTDFGTKSAQSAVNLNAAQFIPEVLRVGFNPTGYANTKRDFDAAKNTKTLSYDLKICALGGRVRASVSDHAPIDQWSAPDRFSIAESACEELSFRTDPSVLSSLLTEITRSDAKQFELQSQGQLGRIIGKTRYAGSVASLKQRIDLSGDQPVIDYLDGAIGYCSSYKASVDWNSQCALNGVVMDGLRVRKQIQTHRSVFPGTSYVALSMADGLGENKQPKQAMYDMVGQDLAIQQGAFVPTEGTMTVVGRQGEKIRLQFSDEKITATRLNALGEATGQAQLSAKQIMMAAGLGR
ncbi:hypothetical protein NQT62_13740 [Limnobacter humi]|uniref:Uncharacterized protein n=1 Tax=Limnobacter humi TaxID=1778671 RepID=A0ABT1WIZ5_9BURK|nr:hypothetical protein [Limnobacter humi]MCQ8897498.1 hypothetical protein [Limnobacter humi]